MQARKGRPEPVSCQLCRSKKLRCNRAQPCSNCESRNVPCHFLVPPPRSQRTRAPGIHSDADILARVERLESILLAENTPDGKRLDSQTAFTPHSEDVAQPSIHGRGDTDLHLLENIGVREDLLISSLSNDLAFTILSVCDILKSRVHLQYAPLSDGRLSKTIITFPTYDTAVILFDCFEANVDHMCRILHLPTVRSLMRSFYIRTNQKESVLPGQAALLLSLFALSAFFYQPKGNVELVVTGLDTAYLSKYWSKGALDVLEHSRRNTSGTLEDIQALILMSYVTYHLDGFSARYRHFSALTVSMARDLGLHRLDADGDAPEDRGTSLRDFIDQEVKRRVYWHIIAADWMHSTMSGPQEGTYFINPNHIHVKLPQDSDDEDMVIGNGKESVASPQPTGLTFLLARIGLARLCREYTDTIPLETSKLIRVSYEHIISLDEKLQHYLTELPYFFRHDEESRQKSKHLEVVYMKIPMMRYCILAAAHTRRCRLHQKFLIRKSSDTRYAYSRQACLESARTVVQLYEEPRAEGNNSPSMETARMAMAVHYTHLALVILVMDLCFNKDEADNEERKGEVLAALQMLEGTRSISPLLSRSLDSVVQVLHKHQVYLSGEGPTSHNAHSIAQEVHEGGADDFDNTQVNFLQRDVDDEEGIFTIDPSINEFWQSANHLEMDFNSAKWDTLFSNLDSRPF
ncbi:fungal-specific transcription factor domain-containing protein [Xylariaceae sp. AK1471]|nr:fungal-specific transcription factor domain-containing protein [Xylariaceae sp. AK1471]